MILEHFVQRNWQLYCLRLSVQSQNPIVSFFLFFYFLRIFFTFYFINDIAGD